MSRTLEQANYSSPFDSLHQTFSQHLFNESLDIGLYPLYRRLTGESWNNISHAREIGKTAGMLVALNHVHKYDIFFGTATLFFLLDPHQERRRSFLISAQLLQKPPYKLKAVLTQLFCYVNDTEAIPVCLPKHHWDSAFMAKQNQHALDITEELLGQPKTITGIFPEAEITPKLVEAKPGLGRFIAKRTGYTVPVTTNVFNWALGVRMSEETPAPLTVHKPIENDKLFQLAQEVNGIRAEQIASDYVMCEIAQGLPEHQRGFYAPFVTGAGYEEKYKKRISHYHKLREYVLGPGFDTR